MAGIQVSGLLSNSAFDWKSVVDQLVAADGIPIQNLQKEQGKNNDKASALGEINTALQDLQDSVQAIRANDPFENRTVSSDNGTSSWKATSAAGAAIGSYKFNVTQLASATKLIGAGDVGSGISATNDVTGLTLSNMRTATAVSSTGFFTINGQRVTVNSSDSLQTVFDNISTATGGVVTGSYDSTTDSVKLLASSGTISLGAANDTSNFLKVMKLASNGAGSVSSSGKLGIVNNAATLASSGLASITNVDGSGNGSFSINGVALSYNINSDTLTSILGKINNSTAGVTATYDSVNDQVTLTNKATGNVALNVSEGAGGLLDALGLTVAGAQSNTGTDAKFTVNDGATVFTSPSNTLDASSHGISGLTLTVNSKTTETLTVDSDTSSMQASIQNFLDKFNAVQDVIEAKTKITATGGTVSTSVLSDNREVQNWATQLQHLAFGAVTGVTGGITQLDNLGIDFDGTTGHLVIKDSGKLNTALASNPTDVQSFFLTPTTGMVSQMYTNLTNLLSSDLSQQSSLTTQNTSIDDQITTMQARLDAERESLTNSFIQMLDAQSSAQSQNATLTNAFFNKSGN
jgi:flagellar hook-associated protein 2